MILNSPTISGSLTVTGNIITSGSITISGSIASASYATNAELLDGLDSTAFATTGAYSATSASLYATSASLSVTSGSLSATSGSLSATSGSLSATSGSLSTASGSFNTRVTALEVTGSALSSSLLTVSGSGYATSGSLSTASGSFDSRVATIESKYATTGSNTFTSTQVVSGSILQSGSFTTTGTIIAQTINVQTVTSSVVYSSGSNVFGNDIGNSQRFTGSVLITGSLTIAGNITSNGAAFFAGAVCVSNIISTGTSGGRYGTFNAPTNGGYITFEAGGTAFGDLGSYCAQYGTGDATTLSLQSRTGYALALGTNSTEKVRIDTTGNLMVGSVSAGNAGTINVSVGCAGTTAGGLQLWATNAQTHYVQFGDGTAGAGPYAGYIGYAHSTDSLLLGAGAATRAIITSAGVACFSSTICASNAIFSTAGTPSLFNTNITSTLDFNATSRAGFTGIADNCNGVYFGMGADALGISAGIGFFRESSGWNSALAFYTNCITDGVTVPRIQEKMRITSCGNVGIGLTTPVGYASDDLVFQISNPTGGGSAMRSMMRFTNVNSGTAWGNGTFLGLDSTLDFYIGQLENAPIIFQTNSSERMRITGTGVACFACTVCLPTSNTSLVAGTYGTISNVGGIDINIGNNAYYDGTNWRRFAAQEAARIYINRNSFSFLRKASDGAGSCISWDDTLFLASSGIACFACQVCAPSFIGGTMSGTTIYGSTAVCSALGYFNGCVGIGMSVYGGSKLTLVASTNPTCASSANMQLSIGEASQNPTYSFKLGYIYVGGGYIGAIQTIAGGAVSTTVINPDGGNVGIGTSGPQSSYKVTISGTDTVYPAIYLENTTNSQAYSIRATGTNFAIRDNSSGNDRITLTCVGNVGIGTSSINSKLTIYEGDIRLFKTHIINCTGTWASNIFFTDEVDRKGAAIVGERTAWDGAPMALGFDTGGVGTITRRMTITSTGDIRMDATSGSKLVTVKGATGNGNYGELRLGNADHSAGIRGCHVSGGNVNLEFWTEYYSSGGYQKRMTIDNAGNIGAPTGTNIFNASDIRLKQNISTITNGLDKILGLNPVMFNWVDNFVESENGKDMLGFVAQEVQSVIPEAVENFGKTSIIVGETTIETPLRVNEKFIIPVLVKAIQELKAENDIFKTCLGIS